MMTVSEALKSFLEETCSIQIKDDKCHSNPHKNCKISINDGKLVISPKILLDSLDDGLLLSNLEIIECKGSEYLKLKVLNHPELKSLTFMKAKY
ncbi:hypothetical protein AN619_20650 [Thermotalea metallivorans]|uniref:Uncharacterized protein n=2 Tax=Thermotalea metallivorans TaxID=520762 RepID=A0A140L2X0_9FIRM|nr:hypothetical protein AN619_20650 [Thermotalea metallivorans]